MRPSTRSNRCRKTSREWNRISTNMVSLKFERTILVETMRLDRFCDAHSIERIDLVYLDVQGAELMVLRGAGDYLTRIGAVWLEVGARELYDGQPLKDDVELFMQ